VQPSAADMAELFHKFLYVNIAVRLVEALNQHGSLPVLLMLPTYVLCMHASEQVRVSVTMNSEKL
jgi:hypothetical protein